MGSVGCFGQIENIKRQFLIYLTSWNQMKKPPMLITSRRLFHYTGPLARRNFVSSIPLFPPLQGNTTWRTINTSIFLLSILPPIFQRELQTNFHFSKNQVRGSHRFIVPAIQSQRIIQIKNRIIPINRERGWISVAIWLSAQKHRIQ